MVVAAGPIIWRIVNRDARGTVDASTAMALERSPDLIGRTVMALGPMLGLIN